MYIYLNIYIYNINIFVYDIYNVSDNNFEVL